MDSYFDFAADVVRCPDLIAPANGIVLVESQDVGSTAGYMCDNGFTRNGVLTRECMSNGEWSDEAPTCERKHYFHPYIQMLLTFFPFHVSEHCVTVLHWHKLIKLIHSN